MLQKQPLKYIKGLNTLRAFAVLLVLHQHWGPGVINSSRIATLIVQKVVPNGDFAVDIFFVLSGFLITRILIFAKAEAIHGSKINVIKNFIARRSLRIFPIYFLFLAFLYIQNYPDIRQYIVYFATYTANFLQFYIIYHPGLAHTWSLSVEEQFYLLWPFVILFTPDRFLLHIICLFILMGTVVDVITENHFGEIARMLTPNCFTAFAIGGLYSYALVNYQTGAKIRKVLSSLFPIAVILYVLFELNIKTCPIRLINAIIGINIIIYITEKRYGKLTAMLVNNKFLDGIGKISYGIYLYHYIMPTYYFKLIAFFEAKFNFTEKVHHLLIHPSFRELVMTCMVFFISYFSYHFIEINILKLKKYFKYNPITTTATMQQQT